MNIWKFMQAKLAQSIDVMLLVVVDSEGSSPGRQGFKMAATKTKDLFGSIGGGTMEYEMVELAVSMMKSGNLKPLLKLQIHSEGNTPDKSGMICSGKAKVLFFPLNARHLTDIEKIIHATETSGDGAIEITQNNFGFNSDNLPEKAYHFKQKSENEWLYTEKPGLLNRICIIGAGHVGLSLSKIMKDLDFVVEIYDNRLGLNTFENNEYVNKKHKIDYNEIDQLLPEGDNVYVVIMTFGHLSDELVLSKLIRKRFKYLGLMGSTAKVKRIFHNIGYNPESKEFTKVYAPVGISINSKTPFEIAISIAAEIIKLKNSTH